ncbi:MAG: substrate-binding domain-containing protein [Blastocatellia bacterium]|nr:substrate-binding domain-containing protein [Blastocatellia bacterium]
MPFPRNVKVNPFAIMVASLLILGLTGCRRKSDLAKEASITVYGFSVVKEPLENEIFPSFQREWQAKTGQVLNFTPSFAGSEVVTNQIIAGVEADVAILAIERNADRLVRPDVTRNEWRKLPYGGIVNRTPIVIIVRQGNPKRIRDFADLANPGVRLIHADPSSSGAGQWGLLAMYGAELIKSEKETGARDSRRAFETLRRIWKNVLATPESARQARTQFERGEGDALVTYELEALQLQSKGLPIEVVTPRATVFCEHPVVIIDHGMTPGKYALVELFVRSLWEPTAQRAWVNAHFRSVTDESLNDRFPRIELPFFVKDLGGWARAYPEIIENEWKQRIQAGK